MIKEEKSTLHAPSTSQLGRAITLDKKDLFSFHCPNQEKLQCLSTSKVHRSLGADAHCLELIEFFFVHDSKKSTEHLNMLE